VALLKKEYYKALYEFEPRNPDEMALDEGDIVLVGCLRSIILTAFENYLTRGHTALRSG